MVRLYGSPSVYDRNLLVKTVRQAKTGKTNFILL